LPLHPTVGIFSWAAMQTKGPRAGPRRRNALVHLVNDGNLLGPEEGGRPLMKDQVVGCFRHPEVAKLAQGRRAIRPVADQLSSTRWRAHLDSPRKGARLAPPREDQVRGPLSGGHLRAHVAEFAPIHPLEERLAAAQEDRRDREVELVD
jgi:hypothetical protein